MSFQVLKVNFFPEMSIGEVLNTSEQLSIPGYDREAETTIRYHSDNYFGFKHYIIQHEMFTFEEGIAFGIVETKMHEFSVTGFLQTITMEGYYDENDGTFYLCSKSSVIKSFLKKIHLARNVLNIGFEELDINLHSLVKIVPEISSAWLKGEGSKISAFGLYGPDVSNGEEYRRLIEDNSLSSIIVAPILNGKVRKVQVNTNACVYFSAKIKDEAERLTSLREFKRDYIDKVIVVKHV